MMKKKILCLCMAVALLVGTPLTAAAEDYLGSKDWTVAYKGDKMDSNFKGAEMTEEILNIQPGDSITLQVNLKNDVDYKADWYMTNEVLQTLEDSNNSAEGGAYTYILTYHAPDGAQTVLYSSEVVGGENVASQTTEGLHQATAGLENYFFLDRLTERESAYITLYVQLDGETQGNSYQDTLARLKMNFAVEKVNDAVITQHVTNTVEKVRTEIVKTGDESNMVMYSVLFLAAAVVLIIVALVSGKKEKDENNRREKGVRC